MKTREFIKNCLKVSLIIGYVWYRARFALFGEPSDAPIHEMLKYNILGAMTEKETNMVLALEGILFLLYFHLIFGTYISKHFENMPSYYFSRIANKKKWFLGMVVKLFSWSVVYVFLYLGSELMVVRRLSRAAMDDNAVVLFILLWTICTILCFWGAVLINIFSIIWNKIIGFVVFYVVVLFCLLLPNVTLDFTIQFFNPFSYMDMFEKMDHWLWTKMLYLTVLMIGAVIYGVKFLGTYDISLKEVD